MHGTPDLFVDELLEFLAVSTFYSSPVRHDIGLRELVSVLVDLKGFQCHKVDVEARVVVPGALEDVVGLFHASSTGVT